MASTKRHNDNSGITIIGDPLVVTPLLIHMESLSGVKFIAKKSWVFTDDFEAYFLYKGHLFVVETPFVDIEIAPVKRVPEEIKLDVLIHAEKFSWVSPIKVLLGMVRFLFLPINPPR